jgi:hypothetical protein
LHAKEIDVRHRVPYGRIVARGSGSARVVGRSCHQRILTPLGSLLAAAVISVVVNKDTPSGKS